MHKEMSAGECLLCSHLIYNVSQVYVYGVAVKTWLFLDDFVQHIILLEKMLEVSFLKG